MTIFVSIASYRDPELIPTIEHCIQRARYPDDLRFGICWQHGEGDPAPPALDRGRMRVRDVPWRESRGACWARAECMRLYDGEDHFLQLDSHHRFAQDWDAVLLDQAERSGAAKPVLTTYAAAYDPHSTLPETDQPTCMRLDRFTPEGIALFQFGVMPGWQQRAGPMRARFVSGHLLFAPGSFVGDVPYDPDLYFIGEEITLAIRAFTHGYDLFHPSVHIAWHEYTRKLRTKHWDDHLPAHGVDTPWHARDAASLAKVARFLSQPEPGPFGCGGARRFSEYEDYAGINFRRRFATRDARRGVEPGPPPDPCARLMAERTWTVRLALDPNALAAEALDNPLFWYVGFHDANGVEIVRDDAGRPELRQLISQGNGKIRIERRFTSARAPERWTVWPTDRSGRWLGRIDGNFDPAGATASAIATE
jgi:hypothetical protein